MDVFRGMRVAAVLVLGLLVCAWSGEAGASGPVTLTFEGQMPNGQSLEVAYSFDPEAARATDVGNGTVYDQHLLSATLKIGGVLVPATFVPHLSAIHIQDNVIAGNGRNYDRSMARLEFSPTVSAGGVSFDRLWVIGEHETLQPAFSSVLTNENQLLSAEQFLGFPVLQVAFQLANAPSNPRPAVRPVAFTYDEAVDGDLPSSLPLRQMTFAPGVNRIRGSEFIQRPSGVFDVESMQFVVPSGMEVTSISYEFSFVTEPGALSLQRALSLWRGTFSQNLANKTVVMLFTQNPSIQDSSPVALFGAQMPLQPGTYVLGNSGIGTESGWSGTRSWDYTVRFNVVRTAPPNQPPVADAGPDQVIRAGDTVCLNGAASFDDNTAANALQYAWSFSYRPAGSTAVLSNATTMTPCFVADLADTYSLQLVVTDTGGLSSTPDFVDVGADNLAPTAAAGSDQLVVVGSAVNLDGSASSDPENDTLSYAWTLISAPVGSGASLSGASSPTASFVADTEGQYTVSLAVSDPLGAGTPDSVTIVASTADEYADVQITESGALVSSLTESQVTSAGNQQAFTSTLIQATQASQSGNTAQTITQLENAIARTDGCVLRGAPDGNGPGRDWITDCAVQATTYASLKAALDALTAPPSP